MPNVVREWCEFTDIELEERLKNLVIMNGEPVEKIIRYVEEYF